MLCAAGARRQASTHHHQRPIQRESCETVMSVPALLASSACLPPHLSCHQPGFLCSASYKGLSSTSVLVTGIILRESLQINQSRANSHPGVHATRPGGAMNACLHTPGVHARPPTVFARLGFWRGGAARPGIYTPGGAGVGDPTSPRADVRWDERMTPEISQDTTYTSSPRRARRAVASRAGRRRS